MPDPPSAYGKEGCEGVCAGGFSSHGFTSTVSSSSPCVERREAPLCLNAAVKFRLRGTRHYPPTFADSCITAELKGNKQAEDIKAGVGSLGGLKKSL